MTKFLYNRTNICLLPCACMCSRVMHLVASVWPYMWPYMHKPPTFRKLMFCRITQKEFKIDILPILRLQQRCVVTILLHTLRQFLANAHKHSVETRLLPSWNGCGCHSNGAADRQESWCCEAMVGFIVTILLLQHGRGLPITASLLLSTSDTNLDRCFFLKIRAG